MLPMHPGDVQVTYADIERVGGKLGFEPKPPITNGIPALVEWFRQYTLPSIALSQGAAT